MKIINSTDGLLNITSRFVIEGKEYSTEELNEDLTKKLGLINKNKHLAFRNLILSKINQDERVEMKIYPNSRFNVKLPNGETLSTE